MSQVTTIEAEKKIAARRAEAEAAMEAEFDALHETVKASRKRVGSPILRVEGVMGKRTEGSKGRYNRTAVATRTMKDLWAMRRIA